MQLTAMSIASSKQSFLANALLSPRHIPTSRKSPTTVSMVRCSNSTPKSDDNSSRASLTDTGNKLAKLAAVTLAAGMLTLGAVDVHEASAAMTGGRVGGQAFKSSAPRASSGPRINNSRTNVYINPPIAPPLVGGYGYGVPFYGGWGWSPFSFFVPGPSVAIGIGGGFDVLVLFMVLGTVAAVLRRFVGSANEDDDY
uniref:Uncharacterized protein n=1 Tax=Kalanchoe fedtschenkoi TaxID=63787 RepID=A0A7N0SW44_KALFE